MGAYCPQSDNYRETFPFLNADIRTRTSLRTPHHMKARPTAAVAATVRTSTTVDTEICACNAVNTELNAVLEIAVVPSIENNPLIHEILCHQASRTYYTEL